MVRYVPQVREEQTVVRTCMCGSAHDCGCVVDDSNR